MEFVEQNHMPVIVKWERADDFAVRAPGPQLFCEMKNALPPMIQIVLFHRASQLNVQSSADR